MRNSTTAAPSHAEVKGLNETQLTLRAIYHRFKEQRRVRAAAEAQGVYDSDMDRGIFMLSKQLMYFERYGKMYMRDVSLFDDREFFVTALGHDPAAAKTEDAGQ